MELQHFAHEHLLTLCVCKERNDDVVGHGKEVTCDTCREPISGDDSTSSFYSCTQCDFFMHKLCAELPQKMITIFHPEHQLELGFPDSNYYCDICEEGMHLGYFCDPCKFNVHATCALQSTFEPEGHEHSFILVKPTIFTCDVCGEEWENKRVSNLCTTCQFQGHKECTNIKHVSHEHCLILSSNDDDDETKRDEICVELLNKIVHPFHPHPLTLHAEYPCIELSKHVGNDVGEEKVTCKACRQPISGDDSSSSFYICTQCNLFLHKFCAELPQKMINNIFHPAHQLEIGYYFGPSSSCDICKEHINVGYRCSRSLCNFSIDATCALQFTVEPQGHEHSFVLVKPTLFTCDVCGVESNGVSNLCTTCQLQVHKECTSISFPHTLKQMGHNHKLTLTYSFQLDFVDQPCKICTRKLKRELCVYYCSICPYIAHISCATPEYLKETDKMATLKMMEEDDDENQEHNNNNPEEVMDNNFIHVSHEHRLILRSNDDETKRDEICDGCARPVGVDPFYTCAEQEQCKFFLHKRCVELRNKKLHPLHPHPLTLHAENPWSIELSKRHFRNDVGIFRCRGCDGYCNGFIYACDHCDEDFFLDVTCSLFTDTIQHKGHPCDLNPILGKENTECDACGFKGEAKYRCEGCNFNLGLRCASLKDTTHECECRWYNCDIRPLKLTYKAEDDSGEYYCDICGERRGLNNWFYYCEDCKFVSHPYCIDDGGKVKFGKSYQIEKRHPHSLTLLKEAKGNHPTCVTCGNRCGTDFVLECAECDIRMHLWNNCNDDHE